MNTIDNEPLVRAFLKKERTLRQEKKLYLSPVGNLDEIERLVVDIALNNTVVEFSVLPEEYEKILMLAAANYYQVATSEVIGDFNKTIVVVFDSHASRVKLLVYTKDTDVLVQKQFTIMVPEFSNQFITSNLSKTAYLEQAARLTKERVFQYNENLADVYRLLFHVAFQTDLSGFKDTGDVERTLLEILKDTEVTLHLNITRTIKLYGTVDEEKFLTLNIREIGTPDTYWTRAALLTELISHS